MNRVVIAILFFTLLTSCEDFLTREPVTQVSTKQLLSDINGVEIALSGVYSQIASGDAVGYKLQLINEMKGGNLKFGRKVSSATRNKLLPAYSFSHTFDNNTGDDISASLYEKFYEILYSVNQIIKAVPLIEEGEVKYKNQLLGEAYALRGILHFELSKLFSQPFLTSGTGNHAGIVLVTSTLQPLAQPKREPLYKVYNQIISDLIQANLLLNQTRVGTFSESYITKQAAQAMLSKVYLYKNDWQNALSFADSVLAQPHVFLNNTDYVSAWDTYKPCPEGLWVINYDNIQRPGFTAYNGISDKQDYESELNITSDLLAIYDQNDIRRQLFRMNTITGDTVCVKHLVVNNYDRPMSYIRTSEVYLIRAEAAARTGNYARARSDLQKIRARSNTNAPTINLSGQPLIDEILLERRRELAFEGDCFSDIIRSGRSVNRPDYNGTVNQNLAFPNDLFVLPIPDYAIYYNENLEQNKNY